LFRFSNQKPIHRTNHRPEKQLGFHSSVFSATKQSIKSNYHRERERTVFVGDLDMKEEELEARGVGANDLLESPLKRSSAAYRRVWIPLDSRLVHSHHYPSRLTLHFPLLLPLTNSISLARSLSLSLSLCVLSSISLPEVCRTKAVPRVRLRAYSAPACKLTRYGL
jgi:hypothetical protein